MAGLVIGEGLYQVSFYWGNGRSCHWGGLYQVSIYLGNGRSSHWGRLVSGEFSIVVIVGQVIEGGLYQVSFY